MPDMKAKKVIFKGTVQGVGFRFKTKSLADGFDVAGHVKNLPDGTVELVAEGTTEEVEGLIGSVKERMSGYIRGSEETPVEPSGRSGFQIAL